MSFVRYLAPMAAVAAAGYLTLHVVIPSATAFHPLQALNLGLAVASEVALRLFQVPVTRIDTVLTLGPAAVIVTNECNAVGPILLLTGAIATLPGVPWVRRLAGIAAGALLLLALNVVRVAALVCVNAQVPAWFPLVHEQIAPLVIVLTGAAWFVTWLEISRRRDGLLAGR